MYMPVSCVRTQDATQNYTQFSLDFALQRVIYIYDVNTIYVISESVCEFCIPDCIACINIFGSQMK